MHAFLLRFASADKLRVFGFRLLIAGLVGEAIAIVLVPSGNWEKALSAFFTLIIAAGVWIEEIGLHEASQPRRLTLEQQRRIVESMRPFKGLRVVIGAVPPSAANADLQQQILDVLTEAEVDAFINMQGVEAAFSPTGASNRGAMPTRGFYNGVTLRFVPGNKRGTAFAETLAQALNEQRIAASAIGDAKSDAAVDHRIAQAATQDATLTRDSKEFEPVTVVVGDKP